MAQGTETTLERLPITSADISADLKEALRDLFPEAFDEQGQLDFARLRELLGEFADGDKSRYGLSWAGKQDAKRALLSQSVGTLAPMRGESVEFDQTENLIIEGDNLEVLKLLQKAYYGKVKMIYIDPPYNTGNDFIYPDNFREGLQDYLKYSGQVTEEGFRTSSNTETSGRYHSNWLNMMYPRLALARNLLREDGVIFVSIDDHEIHNLRMLMDEVFGGENFVASICWQKKQSPQNDAIYISDMHDYVVVYAKRAKYNRGDEVGWTRNLFPRGEQQYARYTNPDNDPRGDWTSVDYTCNKTADQRPNLFYAIANPITGEYVWPSRQRVWRFEKATHEKNASENRIWWGPDGRGFPRLKRFRSEVAEGVVPSTWWTRTDAGDNQQSRRELRALFPGIEDTFDTPKPVRLLRRMLELATSREAADLILDFFAGSGTTAQAVMDLNREDGGNRRFLLVQLPEPLDKPIKLNDGTKLNTIADICRERVRRAAKKLNEADASQTPKLPENGEPAQRPDRGFRAFKLTSSNFKLWEDNTGGDTEKLKKQLKLYAENVLPGRDPEWVVYEILLKSGVELSANVERTEGDTFSVGGGRLIVCLDDPVEEARLRELIESGAEKIVCLDHGFQGNDALKANIAQQVKQWNSRHPEKPVEFRTV